MAAIFHTFVAVKFVKYAIRVFKEEKHSSLATLPWPPDFLTSVMVLVPLWTPSVQKWSLYSKR